LNLAVVCEIPEPIQMSGNLMDLGFDQNAETAFALDGGFLQCKDLSANAAKSARDAFAYCQGPFGSMEFHRVTGKPHEYGKMDSRAFASLLGCDWLLFMYHDCLVDIQAFEFFCPVKNVNEVRFRKWTTAGPSGASDYTFLQTSSLFVNEVDRSRTGINRRILIEPE